MTMGGPSPALRPGGGPAWLVTFADLIALLIAFFVMIYATQKVETGDWQAVVQSLSQSLKSAPREAPRRPAAKRNLRLLAQARAVELPYLEALLRGLRTDEPALARILIRRLDDRLIVALPGDLLFRPGRAQPVPGAEEAIAALARLFGNIGNRIDVFGHTDPRPVRGGRWASNWALSLARAEAVGRLLRKAGYRRRFAVFGVADSRFAALAGIASRSARYRLARRVDIVIRPERETR